MSASYTESGVNIAAADQAKKLMHEAVQATHGSEVLAGMGAFAGIFDASSAANEPNFADWLAQEPLSLLVTYLWRDPLVVSPEAVEHAQRVLPELLTVGYITEGEGVCLTGPLMNFNK